MHPTLNDLLTVRDGGKSDANRHVLNCKFCQQELANIETIADNLSDLPEQDVPLDAWKKVIRTEGVDAKIVSRSHRRFSNSFKYGVAASFVITVFITLFAMVRSPNILTSDQPELMAESKALIYTLAGKNLDKSQLTSRQQFKIEQLQWQLMMLDQRLALVEASNNSEQLEQLLGQRIQHLKLLHAAYSGNDPSLLRPVERNIL